MSASEKLSTIGVRKATVQKVKELKPFETMSHEELLLEALDAYEGEKESKFES